MLNRIALAVSLLAFAPPALALAPTPDLPADAPGIASHCRCSPPGAPASMGFILVGTVMGWFVLRRRG